MASVNKSIIVGNLGKDPESIFTQGGTQITKFPVATTDKVKRGDSYEEETEWHNIVCFKKNAQFCADYLKKGSKVYVEGKIKTSSWEDENGQKRYKTEIIARDVKSLSSMSDNNKQNDSDNQNNNNVDDLPF